MSSPPPYQAHQQESDSGKFPTSPKYKDIPWAVLFVVQLVILVVVAVAFGTKDDTPSTGGTFDDIKDHLTVIIATWVLSSILVSFLMLWIIRTFGGILVWVALIGGCIATGLVALVLLSTGAVGFGILFVVLFVLNCLYVYFVRNRIPFAVAMMETVVQVIRSYSGTLAVAFGSIFVQAAWIIVWSIAAVFVLVDVDKGEDTNSSGASAVFLVFSFFWTSQVISGVVLVSVAGVFAEWYFRSPQVPEGVTWRSFKRASTTSLGSVCFGSFVVAAVQTLKFMVNQARQQDDGILLCIADCLLNCLEDILNYLNLYAFTYVAVYGMSYCEAGKSVWQLFSTRGWDIIINDDLIGGVLTLGSIIGGVIVALISYGVASAVDSGNDGFVAFVGFFIGLVFVLSAFVVVQAGVSCVMVCYAEDPAALSQSNPEAYTKLTNAFRERYGSSVRI